MMELSSVVKTLTPHQDAAFKKHKALLRAVFFQASAEIGGTVWREQDDAALDAATLWLYQRSAEVFAEGSNMDHVTRLERALKVPTMVTQQPAPKQGA